MQLPSILVSLVFVLFSPHQDFRVTAYCINTVRPGHLLTSLSRTRWAEYLSRVPKDATTIYILTEAAGYRCVSSPPSLSSLSPALSSLSSGVQVRAEPCIHASESLIRITYTPLTVWRAFASTGCSECKYFPACKSIGKQLVAFLRKEYPKATVAIRRGHPNEAMVMMARGEGEDCGRGTREKSEGEGCGRGWNGEAIPTRPW